MLTPLRAALPWWAHDLLWTTGAVVWLLATVALAGLLPLAALGAWRRRSDRSREHWRTLDEKRKDWKR